ncbi:MAG: hypothetical protein FWG47_08275 [Propionibacteriaceae bacterium]|nr:hypothetical protein [Propionibacteriaceae bacterium]
MRRIIYGFLAAIIAISVLPATQTAAVAPAPAADPIAIALDIHPGYKPQKECSTAAKPGAKALLETLIKNFEGTSLGISRSCSSGGTSEHKEGRALDWGRDVKYESHRKSVDAAMEWLTANNGEVAIRLGVMYILWDQKIWSTYYPEMGWRRMPDRGSYSQNHKDHVHISLTWDGAMQRTSWWTGTPVLGKPCLTKECAVGKVAYPQLTTTRPFVAVKAPLPFVPYPSKMPEISGSPIVGKTLGVTIGNDWHPALSGDTNFDCPASAKCSYQWYRSSAKIAGAVKKTYTVLSADYSKCLNVEVTVTANGKTVAKKAGETTDTISSLITYAAKPNALPAQVVMGKELVATHADWEPAKVVVKYQWLRDGKAIAGATSSSYKTVKADLGKKISVKLTGSSAGVIALSITSNAAVVVAGFAHIGTAKITGVNRVGGKLTVSNAGWSPKPKSYKYQWFRNGKPISKATKSSYTLTDADVATLISVQVNALNPNYLTGKVNTALNKPVAAGIKIAKPKISGTAKVNKKLTATPGGWGPKGVKLTYRWYRNGKAIGKATKSTYKLVKADQGKKITVKVTGKLSGYPTRTVESAATAKVKK